MNSELLLDDVSLLADMDGGLVAAAVQVAAALCCVAVAQPDPVNSAARLQTSGVKTVWRVFAIALMMQAMFSLLRGNLLLTDSLREAAQVDGWYDYRRFLQFLLLIFILPKIWRLYEFLKSRVGQGKDAVNAHLALRGISLQLGVTLLQVVSFHYTDLILNLQLLGMSLADLLSLFSMIMVVVAAIRDLVRLNRV